YVGAKQQLSEGSFNDLNNKVWRTLDEAKIFEGERACQKQFKEDVEDKYPGYQDVMVGAGSPDLLKRVQAHDKAYADYKQKYGRGDFQGAKEQISQVAEAAAALVEAAKKHNEEAKPKSDAARDTVLNAVRDG